MYDEKNLLSIHCYHFKNYENKSRVEHKVGSKWAKMEFVTKQWKMFLQEVVVRLHHTNITNSWFFFFGHSHFSSERSSLSFEDVTLITSEPMTRLTQSSGWWCHLPVSTLPSRCSWRRSECRWLPPPEGGWGRHSGAVGIWKNMQVNTLVSCDFPLNTFITSQVSPLPQFQT